MILDLAVSSQYTRVTEDRQTTDDDDDDDRQHLMGIAELAMQCNVPLIVVPFLNHP